MSKVPEFIAPDIALLQAIEKDDSQYLKEILELRPDLLNEETQYSHLKEFPNAQWRPIHYAAFCHSVSCVKELITYPELAINDCDNINYTPLFYAVESLSEYDNALDIINLLLQHPDMDVNTLVTSAVYFSGPQPVIFDAMVPEFYRPNAVKAIITHPSFDSTKTNQAGESILHAAISTIKLELIKLIAPVMQDINCQCKIGNTVLQELIFLIYNEELIDYIDELYKITDYLLKEFDFDFTLINREGQSLMDCLDSLYKDNSNNDEATEEQVEKCFALIDLVRTAIVQKEQQENNNNNNSNQFFQQPKDDSGPHCQDTSALTLT